MVILFRIDDRLIHAQVVVGWEGELKPDRIVLADDLVSAEDWEKELYASAGEPDFKASVLPLGGAVEQVRRRRVRRKRSSCWVRGPAGSDGDALRWDWDDDRDKCRGASFPRET